MVTSKTNYDTELSYKQWIETFKSTPEKLDKIAEIGVKCYFDSKYMNVFFAEMKMLLTVRKSYIRNFKEYDKELDKIGDEIFKDNYLEDLENEINNAKLKHFQYKIMKKLNKILGKIQEELSESEILPKVKKIDKVPGAVRST